MRVFTSLADVPEDFGPSAVTIGKFDGVHIGHRRMIDRLLTEARDDSLVPTVLTFDRNPLSVLAPAACPPSLISNNQKIELLELLGVDVTLMLTFDRAFSERAPEEFVESVLVNTLHARVVYVGPDFRFGRGGKGNVELLDDMGGRHGFEVRHFSTVESGTVESGTGESGTVESGTVEIGTVESGTGGRKSIEGDRRRVSSTWVRERLAEGDVAGAAALLGRVPAVRGTVVRGAQRGRALGFPTANLSPESEGLAPADGVYAAWALTNGSRYPAAVSIGNNPTFDGVIDRQVEAYLLSQDFEPIDLDLYGLNIEVRLVDRIRGMVAFDDVESLIAGIAADVERVCDVLRREPEPEPEPELER